MVTYNKDYYSNLNKTESNINYFEYLIVSLIILVLCSLFANLYIEMTAPITTKIVSEKYIESHANGHKYVYTVQVYRLVSNSGYTVRVDSHIFYNTPIKSYYTGKWVEQ